MGVKGGGECFFLWEEEEGKGGTKRGKEGIEERRGEKSVSSW